MIDRATCRSTTRLDARSWGRTTSCTSSSTTGECHDTHDRARPPATGRETVVRPMCDRLRSEIAATSFWTRFWTRSKTCLRLILIMRLFTITTTSCTIYLRSFAIWLLDWSYIGRNLVARPVLPRTKLTIRQHINNASKTWMLYRSLKIYCYYSHPLTFWLLLLLFIHTRSTYEKASDSTQKLNKRAGIGSKKIRICKWQHTIPNHGKVHQHMTMSCHR